jgi:hypothetical protein
VSRTARGDSYRVSYPRPHQAVAPGGEVCLVAIRAATSPTGRAPLTTASTSRVDDRCQQSPPDRRGPHTLRMYSATPLRRDANYDIAAAYRSAPTVAPDLNSDLSSFPISPKPLVARALSAHVAPRYWNPPDRGVCGFPERPNRTGRTRRHL